MYLISTIAFLFYITKFPERIVSVNYIGTSHQLWHLLIFLALSYWTFVVCGGVRQWRQSVANELGFGVCPGAGGTNSNLIIT